jgi:hypothetical protein
LRVIEKQSNPASLLEDSLALPLRARAKKEPLSSCSQRLLAASLKVSSRKPAEFAFADRGEKKTGEKWQTKLMIWW